MDEREVTSWVQALGVPAELVSVGVEVDGRWCLLPVQPGQPGQAGASPGAGGPDGVLGDDLGWEVFWREQGDRFDWARFSAVDVACWYLLGRLAHSQLLRGMLGPVQEPREDTGQGTR